jgi:hypothetical protein
MGMFYTAYFDASGKHTKKYRILSVAGALAPIKKWIRFEQQWNEVLKNEGLSEFHATDFHASQGEYKDWKGDKERRSKFLNKLKIIVENNTNKLFSVSVELDAWDEVNKEYYLEEILQSPYALAGLFVVDQTLGWAKRKGTKNLKIVFEDGDEGWGGLVKLCIQRNVVPVRLPKQIAIPCQVGDLLAWKTRITGTNALHRISRMEIGTDPANAQFELDELISELNSLDRLLVRPGNTKIFSIASLRKICVGAKIPKRTPGTIIHFRD